MDYAKENTAYIRPNPPMSLEELPRVCYSDHPTELMLVNMSLRSQEQFIIRPIRYVDSKGYIRIRYVKVRKVLQPTARVVDFI